MLTSAVAQADPTVWARAANPELARQADLLEQMRVRDARAHERHSERTTEQLRLREIEERQHLKRSRELLVEGGAATSPDPHLRYTLARVERALHAKDKDNDRILRAAELLRFVAASKHATSIELRASALYDLSVCHALLGQRDEEIVSYAQALEIEPHPMSRSVLLANQAEAFMARGELGHAIRGYREALALLPNVAVPVRGVTTIWGLAVALDRSGDHRQALDHITVARSYDPNDQRLRDDGWFFMPPYDAHWYAALGFWSQARAASSPSLRAQALQRSIESWRAYISAAPATDPWLAIAERRLEQSERELARSDESRNDASRAVSPRAKNGAAQQKPDSKDDPLF
jgi:tetratricopeptide (TPR) repeat protein